MADPQARTRFWEDQLDIAELELSALERKRDAVALTILNSRTGVARLSTDDYVDRKIEHGNLCSAIKGAEERLRDARGCYLNASRCDTNEEVARFKANRAFRPCIADCNRAYLAWIAAFDAEGVVLAAGENFRTLREKIDAQIAEERTHRLANFTRARFEDILVKDKAERIANKQADAAGIVYVSHRRKPQEVHL